MTRRQALRGVPREKVISYYQRRAAGGVGLIVTEGTYIDHPAANAHPNVPAFFGSDALAGWSRVVEAVHREGARIVPQLWHVGAVRRPGMEPNPLIPGYGPVSIYEDGREVVRGLTSSEIADILSSFARAARSAEELGFDGLEIHGAHGYLIDQFLWGKTNNRTDQYGGSIENRIRLALEVVAAVRSSVSNDFPIIFRLSQWKSGDYEARIAENRDELERIVRPLADVGVDCFHVSTRRFWEPAFSDSAISLAGCVRYLSGKPTIAVGSVGLDKPHESRIFRDAVEISAKVTSLDKVIEQFNTGAFDLVAVGRSIIADPDWPRKVYSDDFDSIRPFSRECLDIYP